MAREINCPACGNRGEATIDDTGAFEVRGQLQGKAVRRCKKCGAGLLVGLFSGGFLGKPKLVPSILWERMLEVWGREFESESKTESIPVSQLAHDLAETIIASSSFEKISEAIQAALDQKPPNINDRMRHEWLILNMLAATYGVQKADIQPSIIRNIQDQFHYSIYHTEFCADQERAAFEQLVQDRYTSYWAILNKQDVNIFEEIGRFFLTKFMQNTDILLVLLVSELFFAKVKFSKNFVENVSKKFEIAL